jgi:hypothetical protein
MTADRQFVDPAAFRGHRLRNVRQLLADCLEAEGFSVELLADGVRTGDGRVFGLGTLLGRCRTAPPEAWPDIVAEQVRALLDACRPHLLDELDLAGAPGRVYPRLLDRRVIPWEQSVHSYARRVAGDLIEMLVLETDLTVMWLRDTEVERMGLEPLRAVAFENLAAVRARQVRMLALAHGARVHVLEGGGHTATQVLRLPEVLRSLALDVGEGGVIVAIPTKYELWLHPVVDHHAYAAYCGLFEEAARAYSEDPGALSPHVYWWQDGRLVQIMTERAGLPHADDGFVRTCARIAEASDPEAAYAVVAKLGAEIRSRHPQ